MKFAHKLVLVVLGVIFLVLGLFLIIGVVQGDDTGTNTNRPDGGTGMPSMSSGRPAGPVAAGAMSWQPS